MNDRQRKKNFKKIVGINPKKGMSKAEMRVIVWALHPKRRRNTKRALELYGAKWQQVINLENFNRIMAKRRMR